MMLFLLAVLIMVATCLATVRWRWGLYGLILVALVQDPIRKLIPGTPGYLVLATLPVWGGIMVGAIRSGDLSWSRFRREYPALTTVLFVYLLTLIMPAIMSATYSAGSWQLTLLGAYTQFAVIGGLIMGAHFPLYQRDLERLMAWYCILAGIIMIGAPMERMGIGTASGLTGTSSMGAYWVTYRTGAALNMISGFFRSPDVMGWHAASMIMFGAVLAVRNKGWRRIGWAILVGWGGVALMFCARRKMVAMMIPYAVVMAVLFMVFNKVRNLMPIILCGGVAVAVWFYAYQGVGSDDEVEKFYSTTLEESGDRLVEHGVDSVVETIRQAGFWGYGLGMAAQGTHHIKCKRPRIWQESGPSMLAAELGVLGLLAFLAVVVALFRAVWMAVRNAAQSSLHAVFFGLTAMIMANGVAAIVSAQVFGDPFIGVFLPFVVGLVLSGGRLNAESESGAQPV